MSLRYNKKNRAIISGILVGVASIYAVATYFNVSFGQLNSFLLSTLLFFAVIVLLAAFALLIFKVIARLLNGRDDQDPDPPV